jgi:hypothetical protein
MHLKPAIALTALLLGAFTPLCAQDAPAAPSPQPPTTRSGMMSCEGRAGMEAALTRIDTLLAKTRQSVDPSEMRVALDQIGAEVAKLRESMKKCAGMMQKMEMMEKMKPAAPPAGSTEPDRH